MAKKKRKVEGLISAEMFITKIGAAKDSPNRNPKEKEGNDWELTVANLNNEFHRGMCLRFMDVNGPGLAFPDLLYATDSLIVVIECKLEATSVTLSDLDRLYLPLLRSICDVPVFGLYAVKNPGTRHFYKTFDEALKHIHECPIWSPL